MRYTIPPDVRHYQGCFSRERTPVLTIDAGDTIVCQTLDAGWGLDPFADDIMASRIPFDQRVDPDHDRGNCLVGPIAIRGAAPGMTLEVQIHAVQPGPVGATWAGEGRKAYYKRLGIEAGSHFVPWRINLAEGVAQTREGRSVALQPFMGVMGVTPAEPGIHTTTPPRAVGGNLDCKELVAGSTLYLPIQVEGALFAVGDGHAAQGDGELCGTAIECGMDHVELTLRVRDDMPLTWPLAETPAGWIALGADPDLSEAMLIATRGMLDLLMRKLNIPRIEALALASSAVDLHITQVVNQSVGVHAILPYATLDRLRGTSQP